MDNYEQDVLHEIKQKATDLDHLLNSNPVNFNLLNARQKLHDCVKLAEEALTL